MARVQKITTNATFIDGRYVPKGFPVMVETAKLSGKERNFADPGDQPVGGVVEMSAVAPTGPNPKSPQQVPHDAVQTVEGHVIPGGARLVGETAAPASEAVASPAASSTLLDDDASAAGNDDDAMVEGTLADILPTLGDKSVEELQALKAAEADREVPRSTLTKAIDKELAARSA